MPEISLPTDRREQVVWLGHLTYLLSCLLLLVWYWLVDAHVKHTLPRWLPATEHVIWDPAGLCLLLGLFTLAMGLRYCRARAVLEGLWAAVIGLVGLVFVAFAYVFD
jgi:hypothetical protein